MRYAGCGRLVGKRSGVRLLLLVLLLAISCLLRFRNRCQGRTHQRVVGFKLVACLVESSRVAVSEEPLLLDLTTWARLRSVNHWIRYRAPKAPEDLDDVE